MTKNIAFLLTVHNRKEKTFNCLISLFEQNVLSDYQYDVFLTDDGCTDGTVEMIRKHFPSVRIISGNGKLYWNRGMWTAGKAAEATNNDYDYIFWLNDDVVLFKDALKHIIECSEEKHDNSIISGIMRDPIDCTLTTFSGTTNGQILKRNGEMQELEYMHGNFVLIPQTVYKSIGIIDGYYSHAGGDGDYSMTAIKNGFKVYTTKDFCGKCKLDTPVPQCFKIETQIFKRFMILYTPLSYSMPKEIFYFDCKHKNIFIAIMHVVSVHIRCLFPKLWLKR